MPGVIIGHNNRIAWGVTNVGPDVQDLYIEHVRGLDGDRPEYEYQGQWLPMDVRQEVIKVKGKPDETLRVVGKGGKERVVPVLPVTVAAIARYREMVPYTLEHDGPLFLGAEGPLFYLDAAGRSLLSWTDDPDLTSAFVTALRGRRSRVSIRRINGGEVFAAATEPFVAAGLRLTPSGLR